MKFDRLIKCELRNPQNTLNYPSINDSITKSCQYKNLWNRSLLNMNFYMKLNTIGRNNEI